MGASSNVVTPVQDGYCIMMGAWALRVVSTP
jgi:hypothetical protein